MCGCVLTDQTYNWWKNWAHVFLSLCVHRILEFGFCEVSLSCNLKLLTSHYVQLQNLELWENPGDFCIVLWFLLGNGGFISVTACITQPQVSYSICVNCWLKTISLPTLQMTAVFPTFLFSLLGPGRICLQQRQQICICMLHEKEQCRDKFPPETRRGTKVWLLRS